MLIQEPAQPEIIDGDIPASGLVAHTLIARFVDHLHYYRQEPISARASSSGERIGSGAPRLG